MKAGRSQLGRGRGLVGVNGDKRGLRGLGWEYNQSGLHAYENIIIIITMSKYCILTKSLKYPQVNPFLSTFTEAVCGGPYLSSQHRRSRGRRIAESSIPAPPT